MNKFNNLLITATMLGAATLAHAQVNYPVRAVRVIVPSAPGGGTDIFGAHHRAAADRFPRPAGHRRKPRRCRHYDRR